MVPSKEIIISFKPIVPYPGLRRSDLKTLSELGGIMRTQTPTLTKFIFEANGRHYVGFQEAAVYCSRLELICSRFGKCVKKNGFPVGLQAPFEAGETM